MHLPNSCPKWCFDCILNDFTRNKLLGYWRHNGALNSKWVHLNKLQMNDRYIITLKTTKSSK